MSSKTFTELYDLIDTLPVISSHEHHMPDAFHNNLTLDRVLEHSYIGWYAGRTEKTNDASKKDDSQISISQRSKIYLLPSDDTKIDAKERYRQRSEFLDRHSYNSYLVWLDKGLQRIYGYEGFLNPENWDWISQKITEKHAEPNAHIEILKKYGKYKYAIQDTYWDYGNNLGHPEFFSPTMRTDMFVTSCHASLLDHDRNSPFIRYQDTPTENFDDYLLFVKKLFIGWREKGAVAMKSASAYERPIQYSEGNRQIAERVFNKSSQQVSWDDRIAYGDFMFNWFCKLSIELDVPFQIHTGLAELSGSQPLLFESVIARYPGARFVLFHSGYPWYSDTLGLAHNYDNVCIDMVWAPIISTTGAIDALHQFIEVAQSSDLIGWGSDTWTSEEAVGAVLAWQFVIARVLSDKIDAGNLDWKKAEALAHKLMYRNNAKIYGFQI